jgi:hypothetical protein
VIITVVVACISAASTIIAALVYRKVQQVHVIVNSRYTDLAATLATAQGQIEDLKSERAIARDEKEERLGP